MTSWQPHIDLVRLLEGLGQEIAAATDDEVREACMAYGRSVSAAASEVRQLLAAMIDDPRDLRAGLPPAQLNPRACSRGPARRRAIFRAKT